MFDDGASSDWNEYYMELDALGRYFLSNFLSVGESIHEWPKLAQALRQMSREAFFNFCSDVREEISRRNNDLKDGMFFLPSLDSMSIGRNHTRQKLSSLSENKFHQLCLRTCFEIGRRFPRGLRKNSLPKVLDLVEPGPFERARILDNYPPHPENCSPRDLSRFLDNLYHDTGSPDDHDFCGFYFPNSSYDYFNATISTIYSVFIPILQDKEQYSSLLRYRGDAAQQIIDLMQMLLDYPDANASAKNSLLATLARLCGKSGLQPRCFALTGIKRGKSQVTSGSFGDIWKGEFQGQLVCLKIVKIYQTSNREHWSRAIAREAVLWGHVSHTNLSPFYGIYHLEDEYERLCLVSPWMDHGNINQYLLQVPSASRLLLAHDIAAGLQYLHEREVIHGDLKGANILVTNSGRACLSDFGLSTFIDPTGSLHESSGSSLAGGTTRWQAPELLNPAIEYPRPGIESDVYAYGCVLYEIYLGKIPFYEHLRDVTVILQILNGQKPSRPAVDSPAFHKWGLTEPIWMAMEECWSTDPRKRPTIPQIISRLPLKGIIDSRPMNNWEEQSASRFRNAIYRSDHLSISVLETVLSWV